jgi:hypothetical protein
MCHRKLFALLVFLSPSLPAQAWLSPQGDGTVSLLYQNGINRLHAYGDGQTRDKGHTYSDALVLNSDFSITDRLAVTISVPFIDSKYVGTAPHVLVRGDPSTAVATDNGDFHGGFQDFRLNVRYALTSGSLKITPLFQATIPSHAYPSFGHAAIGFDEHEYRVGVNVGRRLDPILPKVFVQGQYAFGMTPVVAANVAPKRSYGELQLGYLLNRHITFQGFSALTWSHTGFDLDYNLYPGNLTQDQYLNHDRIARSNLLDAGGSVSYQLNRSTIFFLAAGHSFYGTNGHLHYLVTTVGFTKAFSTKWSAENSVASAPLPEATKATVCACARSK